MTVRLLYLVSHPIQYQAPLLRLVARQPDIDLHVVFERDSGPGGYFDDGFGTTIEWDTPLREGYRSSVEPDASKLARRIVGADIVWMHGWQGTRMLRALATARRHGVPVLMRGENTLAAMPDGPFPRGPLKRILLDWVFSRCDAFLCVGSANREYYRAHGAKDARLFDMPYAVDNDFFRSRAEATDVPALRAELNMESTGPAILFAGKLQRRKHPAALVEAFRRLDRTRLGDPYLLFVGDGEQRRIVAEAAAADSRIRFLGFRNQSELPRFYALADVFVLAADREPWGLAVNEAMNAGCAPVVSTACGCQADLVDDTCGAVVPPGNAAALARALERVLASRKRTAALGDAARQKIQNWNFAADIRGLNSAIAFVLGEKAERRAVTPKTPAPA